MPKAARFISTPNQRKAPYPVVTAAAIAQSSSMTDFASVSLSGNERHASQSWPQKDDETLMRARQQGLNWQPIASQFFPNKTPNACRKRHERLMEKRSAANDWDGVKMDNLAKAYSDVREQMWMILAERMQEKWTTVEAKVSCHFPICNLAFLVADMPQQCMEKGLKNLQTAARTASRREHHPSNSDPGYDGLSESPYSQQQHRAPRDRSISHQDDGDEFNDSAIGPEADQLFLNSHQNEHQRSYASSVHNEQGPNSAGTTTPPYSSTGRSFSTSSSTMMTPSIAAGFHSVQHSSPYQQPSQTLPSFNSAFGMQSLGSMVNRHSPQHYSAVTTQ